MVPPIDKELRRSASRSGDELTGIGRTTALAFAQERAQIGCPASEVRFPWRPRCRNR